MPLAGVGGYDTIERSFDFSKFPNLQEVDFFFRVGREGGAVPWIALALSTLKPATSPRLSAIRLDFGGPPIDTRSVESLVKDAGDDLRQIASEVVRIEREFGEGVVNVIVLRDQLYGAVLDTLNVSFRLRSRGHVDSFSFIPSRSFRTTIVEMGQLPSHPPLLIDHSPRRTTYRVHTIE